MDAARAVTHFPTGWNEYIYAAGYSTGSGTDWDFTVVGLDYDSYLLNVYRYNGPGNDIDEAEAIRAADEDAFSRRDLDQPRFGHFTFWTHFAKARAENHRGTNAPSAERFYGCDHCAGRYHDHRKVDAIGQALDIRVTLVSRDLLILRVDR